MEALNSIVSRVSIVAIVLTTITRILPSDKVYMTGYKFGCSVTKYGSIKFGVAWEKIEDFFTESLGQFFNGFRNGLNSDDSDDDGRGKIKEKKNPNVRV